jgi:hypothetical protein
MDFISHCNLLLCDVYLFNDFSIFYQMQPSVVCSADRKGGSWYKLQGLSSLEGAQGPNVLHMSSLLVAALFINCKN